MLEAVKDYLLEVQTSPKLQALTAVSRPCVISKHDLVRESSLDSDVMLWHYRLGHPSFMYLAKLFPLMFNNKNIMSFQCEICQFSKHSCTSFSSQTYKSSKPFSMIHCDVWGPSQTLNVTGAR